MFILISMPKIEIEVLYKFYLGLTVTDGATQFLEQIVQYTSMNCDSRFRS